MLHIRYNMVKKYTHIRIEEEDKIKLMTNGVQIFLKANPEYEGTNITQNFMIKRAVKVYCREI